jgi:hypothetical protein
MAAADVEHRVFVPRREVPVHERVQLAVPGDEPLGADADVGIVQRLAVALEETGQDRHAELAGNLDQRPRAQTIGNRFRQFQHLRLRERLHVRVRRDAALRKADDLGPLLHGHACQRTDPRQVVRLIAVPVLKLRSADPAAMVPRIDITIA